MVITNKLGLPAPFVSMAQSDYTLAPNEYRVTSLLKGVRETILERRHGDKIERDVSDMIWLLFGTAVHSVLESHEESADEFKEERIKIQIGDYVLSGKFDLFNAVTGTVTDYKTASVWKVIYQTFDDWRRQTLIYCYMLRQIGFDARCAEIIAILKDHSKADAKRKADYPQFPVQKITFDFTEEDFVECEEWLKSKFRDISLAENLPDVELPLCTPEERFNSGEKYAVMKKGRKTALRVLNNEAAAVEWIHENGGDFIEMRKGTDKKCIDYCSACDFCSYYNEHVKGVQE